MTVSAYVLTRIDEKEYVISEEELLEDIRISRKEFEEGKCRVMGPNDRIEDFLPIKE